MVSGYTEFIEVLEAITGDQAMIELDDCFEFGKYVGEEVEDVIEDHPHYIEWLVNNSIVEFSEEALELISKKGIA